MTTKLKEINFYRRKDKYGWLSNFWRCSQTVNGLKYSTNEHYYQSMKPTILDIRKWIRCAPSPYLAMVAGRSITRQYMLPDWNYVKTDFMLIGLRAKFKDPELRKKLIETGDAILHEDSPTDMIWGKKGKDMLGKLLMQVREEIKESDKNEGIRTKKRNICRTKKSSRKEKTIRI